MYIVDLILSYMYKKDKHVYLFYQCIYREVSSRYPVHVQCKKEFLFPFANATFRSDKCVIGGHHF